MQATITIKQHDTKIRFSDTPEVDGVRVPAGDFDGAVISFLLRNESIAIKQEAGLDENGDFFYDPVDEDVANSGWFRQEWEVRFVDGKPLTFPNNGYNVVEILPDLG